MASSLPFDLNNDKNEILLNPRWPKIDFDILYQTAQLAQTQAAVKGHVWLATSGSTSQHLAQTKLVALSKKALVASAEAVNSHLQVDAKDIWAQVLPTFHVGGLGIEVRATLAGSKVIDCLDQNSWNPVHFFNHIERHQVTLAALVPTQLYDLVVAHKLPSPKNLRALVVGGGPLQKDLFSQARALGWPILGSYGMTETASQIATASLDSLNAAVYSADLKVLGHAKVRSSSEGYLEVHAESLLTCYAQMGLDQKVQVWDPKVQGWFKTEDRGTVKDQALTVQGRHQDYIKIGGEATNVAQLRSLLDNALMKEQPLWIPKVALFDAVSERLGSEIHLATTLQNSEAKLVEELFKKLVRPFERIRKVFFLEEFPVTELGKIKWSQLRSQCEERR